MSEMVQRVARAIAQHIGPQAFDDLPKDKQALKAALRAGGEPVFDSQDDILEIARAAITAMTEPTAEMEAEGEHELVSPPVKARFVWRAMIYETLTAEPADA